LHSKKKNTAKIKVDIIQNKANDRENSYKE